MGLKVLVGVKAREMGASDSADSTALDLPAASANHSTERELRRFRRQHKWDPFLDADKLQSVDAAIASGDAEKEAVVDDALIHQDSPYSEVRSSVPPYDIEVPVNTIRAWVIGGLLCTIIAGCNVLLNLRRTPITITSTVVQLVAYPLGLGWAKYMPASAFTLFGHTFELNPGPFNIKEHTIITMMTAAGSSISYAIDILLAQEIFYKQEFRWGFQILLMISTQAMGFGIAGIARRFLIWPSAMVWPAVLITCSVMYSLHDHQASDPSKTNGWKIGRYSFFIIVALATFSWEWMPLVIAPFLSLFMFPTWIAPKNVLVNQIFGGQTGLGLLPISFDWSVVSAFLNSPLQTPSFAILNVCAGMLLILVGAVGLAWAGPDYYRYLPLSANQNFDRFAQPYNTSRILTPDFTINNTAYQEYSPIILGPTFALSYGLSFATLMSTIAHVVLFYGSDVWNRARNAHYDEPDIHFKLMRKYKEAPQWWFLSVFIVSFACGMIASQVWSTHLTWWAFSLCILIGVVLFIPIGIVQAITNQQTGLNVITEMIVGYLMPGRPVAMMLFKSWGYMLTFNGLQYISDMKVGHYMKIPPRSMFAAQAFAVIWLSFVQISTYNFLRGNIEGILIGPARFLVARRYPRSWARYIISPAMFGAASMVPPATLFYLFQWAVVGLTFNFFIHRRYYGWWSRYNYPLSGALDIGTALCTVVSGIGLGLSETKMPDWWGTTVMGNTLDANGTAVTKAFIKGQTPLGPSSW
ncbi:hypothetical protein CDD81_5740 [Ophiocordyceps australis]|uniref:OPT family small oligopeptide transporter n=1 Tax=Ophiocordyceps australis TaxID=1399860 RepID=A0A2C5Y7E1_9HYPO|nr:hypothetical protein CDD81_5740 [Ophiocordyceps australis]